MLYRLHDVRHCVLDASDGEIGDLHDVYFDDRYWTARYMVVDTGKWLPGRKVLLAPECFGAPDVTARRIPVSLNREQIKDSPDRSTDLPVGRQREVELRQYYGWPLYWEAYPSLGVGATVGMPAAPAAATRVPPNEPPESVQGDSDLRSAKEVSGYHLKVRDGEIGHVEDFLLDDEGWALRYLLVDTRNWLPGKRVLIAPQWAGGVNWAERQIQVDMDRESVKNAPEYNPERVVDREYENRLWDYYGVPGYWI